jgi:hypothetical protein
MTALLHLRRAITAVAMFLVTTAAAAAPPPDWFLEEIKALSGGTGRWIADNSAYKSADEPFEAYGLEWRAGFDGVTMTGRLFGLKDGVETPTFWEFRQYWHPGKSGAVLDQFGWGGVIGTGAMVREGATTVTDQVFYQPDGSTRREGHRAHFSDSDTHVTQSFDIVGGEWKPRRSYVWKREKRGEN